MGDEIFRDFERHIVETVSPRKYVPEYEKMLKCIVEFLSKFQDRGTQIDRVNSIRLAKPLIFFNITK